MFLCLGATTTASLLFTTNGDSQHKASSAFKKSKEIKRYVVNLDETVNVDADDENTEVTIEEITTSTSLREQKRCENLDKDKQDFKRIFAKFLG